MSVSSIASSLAQQSVVTLNRVEGRVEGTQPDGDGDQDDAIRVAATSSVNQASPTAGSIGSQIDVTA